MMEPAFTIKAKDNLALDTIAEYQRLCTEHELHDQAAEVGRAIDEIRDWRAANPDRWKMPDHDHVPASNQEKPE